MPRLLQNTSRMALSREMKNELRNAYLTQKLRSRIYIQRSDSSCTSMSTSTYTYAYTHIPK